jgi:hypothetical protein
MTYIEQYEPELVLQLNETTNTYAQDTDRPTCDESESLDCPSDIFLNFLKTIKMYKSPFCGKKKLISCTPVYTTNFGIVITENNLSYDCSWYDEELC